MSCALFPLTAFVARLCCVFQLDAFVSRICFNGLQLQQQQQQRRRCAENTASL